MDEIKEATGTSGARQEGPEFKINPDHNYYACPVARPGSQLFIVRLEWEADIDDSDEEVDTTDNSDDEDNRDFTLAMINFSGIQYILVGLDRRVHEKVLKIAEDLDLSIKQGYPLARISNSSDKGETKHFPIRCAADSVYTVEGRIDINDGHELMTRKKKEMQLIQTYLENRYKEFEKKEPNNADKADEADQAVEVAMIDEPNYRCPPRKTGT